MTEVEKCSQPECADAWTHLVYWPEQTLQVCRRHAETVLEVAEAQAFHVPVTEVVPLEK